jgi:hypothetical protein
VPDRTSSLLPAFPPPSVEGLHEAGSQRVAPQVAACGLQPQVIG